MSSNNNCSLLILFSLLLILDLTVARSCPRTCGGVDIPYPFGIGMGCYLEKWYEIICVNNSVPLLSIINKEVVSISFSDMYRRYFNVGYGSIRIKNPITSKGCSSGGEELGLLLNLTGYPFYVGHNNMLIAVGCNNTASLTNVEPSIVGCQSTCSTKHHMPIDNYLAVVYCNAITRGPSEFCSEIRIMNDTRCDGIGCCKASMPDRYQQIVGVRIDDNNTQSRGCKVAFLTDDEYFLSNGSDPQSLYANGYVTVELRWFIHTANQSFLGSLGCKSIEEYTILRGDYREYGIDCLCDYNSPSYATCSCSSGYEGNPYLPGECKDINECIRAIRGINGENPICAKGKCVNLQGGYKCAYTNNRPLAIGISTSFGSLIFIGGIYWLYKFIRRHRRLNRKKKFFKRNGGLLLQQQLTSTEGNVENTRVCSSRELEKATENFSLNRILGEGGQGTVYKGMLVDGRIVAVKKSKVVDEDKLEEFINEVVILSQKSTTGIS